MRKAERALNKLARRYKRRVKHRQNGHIALICKQDRRPAVWCASSPTNVDHWLAAVERDCKRVDKPSGSDV